MTTEQIAYHDLCAYTLTRGDATFMHQHVVDAFAAQHADEHSKPMGVIFALIGLYLSCEKGYSGRQVQRVHMLLARTKSTWPNLVLPADRGRSTAVHVMAAPAGAERDHAIHAWCASVWAALSPTRRTVTNFLHEHGIT